MSEVTNVSQADYMKLFMQELSYQDPLKPVDNREFMAQMAQFSALQQAQATTEQLEHLAKSMLDNQSLILLGKHVKTNSSNAYGQVKEVTFEANRGPALSIQFEKTSSVEPLENIIAVQ